jgi:CO/xanthine dehydrogenase Mo-binding subunit
MSTGPGLGYHILNTGGAALPGSLQSNKRLSQWLRFRPDGVVEVFSGKVEIGQGILTAVAQIAADELDVDIARVRMVAASTAMSPNEGVTSGSYSIEHSGMALRYACAEARAIFLDAAAQRLGVAAQSLEVKDGTIAGPGNLRTSYWELADAALLARCHGADAPARSARKLAGTLRAHRHPDKVFGRRGSCTTWLCPACCMRARAAAAVAGRDVDGVDEAATKAMPVWSRWCATAASWRGGRTEEVVIAARRVVRGRKWQDGDTPPTGNPRRVVSARGDHLHRRARGCWPEGARCGGSTRAPTSRTRRWRRRAPLRNDRRGSQGVDAHPGHYNLRADLALVFALDPEKIVVEHAEGAGCYGQNGADDVALEAALLARGAKGRPVSLLWSREDEMAWAPLGAYQAVDIEADLDDKGEIVGWRHDVWGNGHVSRPGRGKTPTLQAAWQLAKPFPRGVATNPPLAGGGGSERNATPLYDFPAWRIANHRLLTMPIRTSSLRTLGAFANVFAIESFMDELAAERGEDPVAFRLRHLADPRARAVIEAAAKRAGWSQWTKRDGAGHGIAFSRYKLVGAYCAVVAEVEGDAEIRVKRLVMAVDVGEVINPDGVANQMEGGAVQATSWVLKEAVRFDRRRILSDTWETYPILRFSEVPAVEVEIIARPQEKTLGAGEAAHGPVAGAIANAVFDALGVRVRDLPITRGRLIAAMG